MKVAALKKLEMGINIVLLLYFSGGMGSNPINKLLKTLSYPILLLLIAVRWKRFFSVLTKDMPLLLLVLLAPVSAIWSVSPENTIKYGKAILRSTFFGAYLATRYPLKQQLRLLAWTLGIAALISIFYGLFLPSEGIHGGKHSGLWRGSFVHKNYLGRIMCLSAEVFLLLALSGKFWHSRFLWLGFCLSITLIILSGSTTALATLVVTSVLLPIYNFFRQRQYKLQVIIVATIMFLGIILITFILVNAAAIAASQGKDLTFSGRVPIWSFLFNNYIQHQPLLGYGYSAFWGSSAGALVSRHQGWVIEHAHNGFVELLVDLGLVGFLLYMLSFIPALIRAILMIFRPEDMTSYWPLQMLVMNILIDVGNTTILGATSMVWLIYTITAFSLSIHPNKSKSSHTFLIGKHPKPKV